MQFMPVAHIQALGAQQRHFEAARLDGAVQAQPHVGSIRTGLAAMFDRAARALAPHARPGHTVAV
jgi:hypothetical protein